MSKSNPLCKAPECKSNFGCAHRGPHGELCWFDVEKKLCEFLGSEWDQHVKLDDLLKEISLRLQGLDHADAHSAQEMAMHLNSRGELVVASPPPIPEGR